MSEWNTEDEKANKRVCYRFGAGDPTMR